MTTIAGAMAKTRRSASAGMMSSFWRNLMPSPTSWNQPWKPPGSMGPSRLCMWLIIFSRNVYPRMSAPNGMMARTMTVLIAVVVQPAADRRRAQSLVLVHQRSMSPRMKYRLPRIVMTSGT